MRSAFLRICRNRPSAGGVLLLVVGLLSACSAPRPANLGVIDGQLAPCPSSPNCVSTDAQDTDHRVEPFVLGGTIAESWEALHAVVSASSRARVVSQDEHYLHAEYTSAIFRFVDDLELLLDAKSGTVAIRSASRIGYSDMNANRSRVEDLRSRLHEEGLLR